MWQAREEAMREERGLGVTGLIGFAPDEDEDEALQEAMMREWKFEEEEMRCQAEGDKAGARAAKEKGNSAKRLYRVELIYVSLFRCFLIDISVLLCQ